MEMQVGERVVINIGTQTSPEYYTGLVSKVKPRKKLIDVRLYTGEIVKNVNLLDKESFMGVTFRTEVEHKPITSDKLMDWVKNANESFTINEYESETKSEIDTTLQQITRKDDQLRTFDKREYVQRKSSINSEVASDLKLEHISLCSKVIGLGGVEHDEGYYISLHAPSISNKLSVVINRMKRIGFTVIGEHLIESGESRRIYMKSDSFNMTAIFMFNETPQGLSIFITVYNNMLTLSKPEFDMVINKGRLEGSVDSANGYLKEILGMESKDILKSEVYDTTRQLLNNKLVGLATDDFQNKKESTTDTPYKVNVPISISLPKLGVDSTEYETNVVFVFDTDFSISLSWCDTFFTAKGLRPSNKFVTLVGDYVVVRNSFSILRD